VTLLGCEVAKAETAADVYDARIFISKGPFRACALFYTGGQSCAYSCKPFRVEIPLARLIGTLVARATVRQRIAMPVFVASDDARSLNRKIDKNSFAPRATRSQRTRDERRGASLSARADPRRISRQKLDMYSMRLVSLSGKRKGSGREQ